MKNLHFLIFGIVCMGILSCNKVSEKEDTASDLETLQGTWKLKSYINEDESETGWQAYNNDIIFLKHITASHFSWIKYQKSKDIMLGAGGGTYVFDGNTYIENIDYFYPPGSSELGQSIPFEVKYENGEWHHTGYAKRMELDPDSGEMEVADSGKIQEIWVRVENSVNVSKDLIGTWELKSFRSESDSMDLEHPEFIGYIKHITPTHFNWVYYNAEGDEIFAQGGGRYELKDDKYIEHLDYMFPKGMGQAGTTLLFDKDIDEGIWHHTGYVKFLGVDDQTGKMQVIDSSWIYEIWDQIEN